MPSLALLIPMELFSMIAVFTPVAVRMLSFRRVGEVEQTV
jgi:hypothetical protein